MQRDNGMFFIADDGTAETPRTLNAKDIAFMAVIRKHSDKQETITTASNERTVTCTGKAGQLWHLRLGHAMNLKAVRRNFDVGYREGKVFSILHCNTCVKAKHQSSFKGTLTKEYRVDRLQAEEKGPVKVTS